MVETDATLGYDQFGKFNPAYLGCDAVICLQILILRYKLGRDICEFGRQRQIFDGLGDPGLFSQKRIINIVGLFPFGSENPG
ncbi:hypothetical protein BSY18_4133 (plasmid) [Blastomonas sp. RAC04]|nr:hypothetical protein BSY18_4133 [Blastomonas sp. RAC04]